MSAEQVAQEEDLGLDTDYPLTDEQVASLHKNSWARLPGLLSKQAVATIHERLATQPIRTRTAVTAYHKLAEGEHVDIKNSNVSSNGMSFRDDFFRRLTTSRRLAGTAVRLMGQPTALVAEDTSYTKPDGGLATNPHQDYPYRPFDRWGEVVLWIALVDMSADMGPLYYLEGSHRLGPLGLHEGNDIRNQHPHLFDAKIVAGEPLAAGDAQAHWDLTVHGAVPNTTSRPRAAYAVRYIRSDTHYSGIGNPHFDTFNLPPASKIADSGKFPLVGPSGLIEP